MASRRVATPHEPRRMTRTIPATQLVALLLAFVLVAGAGGVLTAGLAIPLAAATNKTTDTTVALFDEVPDELKPGPLSQASTVYAADGTKLATFYAQNRIVVPLDQVSQAMKDAVVAIEDERFYDHAGVDPRGVLRAFVNNAMDKPTQGASTLTQQYVKNVLIDEAEQAGDPFGIIEAREDTIARKAKEMKLAIALEKTMTKDEILQGYLNVAQFGTYNIYGVETAARYFFDKSAKDLTPVEAATIAGVTKGPAKFDPSVEANLKLAQDRRDVILNKMWSLGMLPTDQRDAALATPIQDTLHITPVPTGCQAAAGAAFFCAYVISEITNNPVFGDTKEKRSDLLYRGGLTIRTTLDLGKQRAAEATVSAHVPNGNDAGLESAVVSVEPGTGKILAMAQNVPFDARTEDRAPGTTSVNYAADPLHGASKGFQPGSNFKPFVLAEWLKEGHTLYDTVDATKRERPQSAWHSSCSTFGGKPWAPANAEGNLSGPITVLRATYESVNTAFASMATELDLCGVRNTAWDMGFRPTTKPGKGGTVVTLFNPQPDDILITPAMVVGTQTTSPLQLAAAYGTLASNGTYCAPMAITQVTKADGTDVPVPGPACNPNALAPNVAATVVDAMTHVFTERTGTARTGKLPDGRAAAGKTGTNQGSAQTWFTGFTPNLVTTVWVGEESGEQDHLNIVFNGKRLKPMYGSSVAVPLWQDYMTQALVDVPATEFPAPDPNLVGTPPAPPAPPTPPAQPTQPTNPGDGGGQGPQIPQIPEIPQIPNLPNGGGNNGGGGGH
ncbi:transglycosylase domain-containing protein [Xylanimonas protaetiae]|uniref:Penicillin-binding protein n=1 Tax=Xylanimonas protaetiae TaxID=2509457 RepID=A0A4P6F195_9MICO|nr:transglycosylase domain-containing protein [Xylanimonas protaetiae]QAY69234.1 penicillin-binding protein [Xylanimonas protaetiae]